MVFFRRAGPCQSYQMFMMRLETTSKIKEMIRATPAPNLMDISGVASEKMKMAMMRAE